LSKDDETKFKLLENFFRQASIELSLTLSLKSFVTLSELALSLSKGRSVTKDIPTTITFLCQSTN